MTDWKARLAALGLDDAEAAAAARRFERAAHALGTIAGGAADGDTVAYWVPGRVEFLGKHTDYAGGRSLVCALGRGFAVLATPRRDARVRIVDAMRNDASAEVVETALDPGAANAPPGHWSTYPIAVVRRVARNFPTARRGVDLAFASNLRPASGMSSSSALVVATFLALSDANDLPSTPEYRGAIHSPEALADYLGNVENGRSFGPLAGDRGVGTLGGAQDHTAILCSRPNALAQYAWMPVRLERVVPFPADHALVVAASGVVARKAGRERERYNRGSLSVAEIIARWHDATGRDAPSLAAVVESSPTAVAELREVLAASAHPKRLTNRLEQFVAESVEIIPAAGDALARGDLTALGPLVDRSQRGADLLLGNQIPETTWLARHARGLGAAAASAFGAGFGGSVWALAPNEDAERLRQRWRADYAERFPLAAARSDFFVTRPGPSATRL